MHGRVYHSSRLHVGNFHIRVFVPRSQTVLWLGRGAWNRPQRTTADSSQVGARQPLGGKLQFDANSECLPKQWSGASMCKVDVRILARLKVIHF